ncbi:MAG TPA: protein-L-isoaspartate(D-aspartate) O-methyltransferase [Gaiellaceae bacterium]|nr:protein-L-isoaspartate(D-aspartate) O-methyltransferase [Gaiellaceae bacterium]
MADWVDRQLVARGIRDRRVLAAMRAVPRERFVPERARSHAYDDEALLLGYGQTISQPYIVALICEALTLRGDEHVLDVGTGSGYQAAVLAELAGSVVSIERIPELAALARENLAGTGVEVVVGDGTRGVPHRWPFDAIAVAAAADELPRALVDQLSPRGRIVIPIGETLVRVDAIAPARFVPLVSGALTEPE